MTKKEDMTSTLKLHNIKNDNMCLGQILDMIKANMNPFRTINLLYLFNIATGKSVSKTFFLYQDWGRTKEEAYFRMHRRSNQIQQKYKASEHTLVC